MTSAVLLAALAILGAVWLARERRHRAALRRRDREIRELTAIAEERGRAADTFFDLVAHELRSPLAAILGYQELLADGAYGELDERASEPVERIGRSARHMLHLVEGIVELGRLRAGALHPTLETLDLGVLMSAVADSFRVQAAERGLEAVVRLPPSLPTMLSDRDRLIRALDLLITSVVKHPAEDAPPSLHVTHEDDGVVARFTGTAIETEPDADNPLGRLGVRLAVTRATTRLLGGDLEIDDGPDGIIRGLVLRLPRPTAGDDARGSS